MKAGGGKAMAKAGREPIEPYRQLFPVTRRLAYLNHAGFGTLPTPVAEALNQHISEMSLRGVDAVRGCEEQRERVREKMARFVGARTGEIAFVKNTPDAIGIVAAGLKWRPGDRVIISDLEFPANAFPWLNLKRIGVETTIVPSVEGRVPIEDVVGSIDSRTRVVSLSWVEFSNGYRNDLRTIGKACHERGALLCVDAMQGLGALRLDAQELNVDFFGAASHKWLCGPSGVGWFFCRQELIDQIDVAIAGQGSYQRGQDTPWLEYDLPFWPDARRFEPGATNFLGVAGLEAVLDLFMEVGTDRIEARVKYLSDRLTSGLVEREYRLASPRDGAQWSGIVSFSSDRHTSAHLVQTLAQAGVSVSLREGWVRVSPHFYNNDEDIDRLFAALP